MYSSIVPFRLSEKFLKASLKIMHKNLVEIILKETQPHRSYVAYRTFIITLGNILKFLFFFICVGYIVPLPPVSLLQFNLLRVAF